MKLIVELKVWSTSAEDIFYSQGDQDNTQEVTLSLRNARVTHDDSFVETRTIGDTATSSTTFQTGGGDGGRLTGEFTDPLAQSFIVDDVTGIYLTSVDVFFQEKPLEFDVPVTLQIREVELGVPNQRILPFSEVFNCHLMILLHQMTLVFHRSLPSSLLSI